MERNNPWMDPGLDGISCGGVVLGVVRVLIGVFGR
jgi:hypothetical protein